MAAKSARPVAPPTTAEAEHYQVVARRYRPQSFAELVGQPHVATNLTNAIGQNRVGHAYLFSGARGTGKTSTARILAKCLNCVDGPTVTPCQKCDSCLGITAGEDIDVLEIDGASNRRIEEIRQLRSNVNVRPSRSRCKIYIIDEVHMLTKEAFNALLKTLEEPPDHVKFFLCTTELEKIPITIRSRCQLFEFMPVEESAIRDRLRQIAQRENVEIEDSALVLLSRRAAGSLRDSQSLLEQLLAVGAGPITLEQVHRFLGTADSGVVGQLVEHLIARDAPAAISAAHASFRAGVDAGQLAGQLVGFFRDCLAASVGCHDDLLLHAAPDQYDLVRRIGSQAGLEQCLAIAQILDESLTRMRSSSHPQVLLEIALIRVCRIENLQAISDLVEQLRQGQPNQPTGAKSTAGRESIPQVKPVSGDSPIASRSRSAPDSKKNEPTSPELAYVKADEHAPVVSPTETTRLDEPHRISTVEAITAENLPAIWKRALNLLGDTTADMAGKYRRLEWHPDGRIVATLSEQFHRYCSLPERKSKVEKVLSEVAGQSIRVEFVACSAPESAAAPQPVSRLKQMRESSREPRVRAAIDIFDAAVIDVLAARPATEARAVAAEDLLRPGGEFDA